MPDATSEYVRLPCRGITSLLPLERHAVWRAADHFMIVVTEGFTEYYKRFYLKDIQAIILRKTNLREKRSVIMGLSAIVMAAVAAIPLMFLEFDAVLLFMPAGILVPFLAAIIVNTALGPTCEVFLQTSVQTERLYALSRLRKSLVIVATMKTAVETLQGPLDLDTARILQEKAAA
ncbi:MAG: hypothetical protein C0404_10025, partial [Verrucomicrobia bacterium]|nr:hypothetical protein [Verrucomicrobiota bacterium]